MLHYSFHSTYSVRLLYTAACHKNLFANRKRPWLNASICLYHIHSESHNILELINRAGTSSIFKTGTNTGMRAWSGILKGNSQWVRHFNWISSTLTNRATRAFHKFLFSAKTNYLTFWNVSEAMFEGRQCITVCDVILWVVSTTIKIVLSFPLFSLHMWC